MKPMILLGVCLASLAWAQPEMNRVKRDIQVLEDALESALSFEFKAQRDWDDPADISGIYLADQGLVLLVRREGFAHHLIPPFPHISSDMLIDVMSIADVHIDGEHLEIAEDALEQAQEAYQQALEARAVLGEQGLDRDELSRIKRENRDKIRVVRKALEKVRAKMADHQDLSDAEREELEKQLAQEQAQLQQQAESIRTEMEDLRKKQMQAWKEQRAKMERTLIEALCDYGASMRSLPDDERISIIFSESGPFHDEGPVNQVYVFTKADLIACRDGKIQVQQLIDRSKNYSM